MPELHVRNLPADLHEQLREHAAREGRSMSSDAVVLLRQALQPTGNSSARQRSAIDTLRDIRQRSHTPASAPPAERLVREDRDVAK